MQSSQNGIPAAHDFQNPRDNAPTPTMHPAQQSPSNSPLRIAICGEIHSDNLGDGVIADSLSYLILHAEPNALVERIDINDRPSSISQSTPTKSNKLPLLHSIQQIPGFFGINPSLRWYRRLRELIRTLHASTKPFPKPFHPYDLVIIGGGQLIVDNDLWFPSRILLTLHRLDKHSRCFAIHACGSGATWSSTGRLLAKRILANPKMISRSFRDQSSIDRAIQHLNCTPSSLLLAPDPALWAAETYGVEKTKESQLFGLGIMTPPCDIQGSESSDAKWLNEPFLVDLWSNLIEKMLIAKLQIQLFTNGDADDDLFAKKIFDQIPNHLKSQIQFAPKPSSPKELVQRIATYRGIIAMRLHASIIAYSLNIPCIAITWDDKLRQFGKLTATEERIFEQTNTTPTSLLTALQKAINSNSDPEQWNRIRLQTAQSVSELIAATRKGKEASHG